MKKNFTFSNRLREVILVDLDHNRHQDHGNESDYPNTSIKKMTRKANHYVQATNNDSSIQLLSII